MLIAIIEFFPTVHRGVGNLALTWAIWAGIRLLLKRQMNMYLYLKHLTHCFYETGLIGILVVLALFAGMIGCYVKSTEAQSPKKPALEKPMQYTPLTPEEERVLVYKGTERAGSGVLLNNTEKGTYLCKRCDSPLYDSDSKFESHCGWPSFDDEIDGAVTRLPDADGVRTEIICNACGGHLGHVFLGEHLTPKDTRHCVNSLSMKFVSGVKLRAAYFASGCFWGTEHFFSLAEGVKPPAGKKRASLSYPPTTAGYMGGKLQNPNYKEVCTGKTGHAETLRVIYDTDKTDYEKMLKLFFETHDFTQVDRQGPDIGPQYRSVIFYMTNGEKILAQKYIKILKSRGYNVATKLEKAPQFWIAEKYHQQYFDTTGRSPTCHVNRQLFD